MEETGASEGLEYGEQGDGYVVTGMGECRDCDVVIPAVHDGRRVTGVGDEAFYEHYGIRSVALPEGAERIGANAFAGSTLERVRLPGSVRLIEEYAFDGCGRLCEVSIEDVPSWCGVRFGGEGSNPMSRAGRLYVGGRSVSVLEIPEGVEEIAPGAFRGCAALKGVVLPKSLRLIWEDAFRGCVGLVEIGNGSPLELCPGDGGNWCVSLHARRVYAPGEGQSRIYSDGDGFVFFDSPDALYLLGREGDEAHIALPSADGRGYRICDFAFSSDPYMESLVIPSGITAVGRGAFSRCPNLKSVSMGGDVSCIDAEAFSRCRRLKEVCLSGGLRELGDGAFRECDALGTVRLPDGLLYVGSEAFSRCDGLSSIVVPESVRRFGRDAFIRQTVDPDFGDRFPLPDVFYLGDRDGWLDLSGSAFRLLFDGGVFFYSRDMPGSEDVYAWHWGDNGEPEIWERRPPSLEEFLEGFCEENGRQGRRRTRPVSDASDGHDKDD